MILEAVSILLLLLLLLVVVLLSSLLLLKRKEEMLALLGIEALLMRSLAALSLCSAS